MRIGLGSAIKLRNDALHGYGQWLVIAIADFRVAQVIDLSDFR